ncbi:MAG: SPOR domain-containing protein, partial [Burkholderiales bacterium]|nr:SPOR domain-containing protein [Burkholderiales bacterium]
MPATASMPLAASAPAAPSAPAQPAAKKAAYCYTWGPFSQDEAEKAKSELAKFHPEKLQEKNLPAKLNYWTYIPPKKNRQEALDAVRALKEAGITDLFLIQEPGKWQYAISLGMFGTEASAKMHASQIRQKGVDSVTSGRRDSGAISFEFAAERKLPEKLESFPKAKLNRSECMR